MMEIDRIDSYFTANEQDIIKKHLPLADQRILELGCGKAWMTRRIAEEYHPKSIIATEVDRIQHEKNLLIDDLPNVRFILGGAEAIPLPDASIDVVLMLKSLHHVPQEQMTAALNEIARVLRPGGLAYISEPVYRGDFNDLLRLFHDEKRVREAAFNAIRQTLENGRLELQQQIFFDAPGHYRDFADFEQRILKVTHTQHQIDDTLHQRIRETFEQYMNEDGAHFLRPQRVDLLRRPA